MYTIAYPLFVSKFMPLRAGLSIWPLRPKIFNAFAIIIHLSIRLCVSQRTAKGSGECVCFPLYDRLNGKESCPGTVSADGSSAVAARCRAYARTGES